MLLFKNRCKNSIIFRGFLHFTSIFLSFLLLMTFCFFLMHVAPGDPFQATDPIPDSVVMQLKKIWGLDKPLYEQYQIYLHRIFHADFGVSIRYPSESVLSIIQKSFPISALLGGLTLIISFPIGLFLGIIWGKKSDHSSLYDLFFTISSTLGISIPNFVIAALLQLFFCICIPLFPVALWGTTHHAILPVISLAIWPICMITRIARSKTIEVLQEEWVMMLRMRGVSERRLLFFHILPHVLIPVLAYLAPVITNLFIGSFAIERVYSIPGLGQWLINSILYRDYPLISGITLFYIALLFVCRTITDIAIGIIDRRSQIV